MRPVGLLLVPFASFRLAAVACRNAALWGHKKSPPKIELAAGLRLRIGALRLLGLLASDSLGLNFAVERRAANARPLAYLSDG